MTNVAYGNLRARLVTIGKTPQMDGYACSAIEQMCNHMDGMMLDDASSAAVGHLFLSAFRRELSAPHAYSSPGMHAIAQQAFQWCVQHEDWSTGSWLLCDTDLQGIDRATVHIKLLPEMAVRDFSRNWPASYQAALKDNDLVQQAIAWNSARLSSAAQNEDTFTQENNAMDEQMRGACYFGPHDGLYGVAAARAWLRVRDEDLGAKIPSMKLCHQHSHIESLNQLVHNQGWVDRFWIFGNTSILDGMHPLDENNLQPWFWRFSMGRHTVVSEHLCAWNAWWDTNYPELTQTIAFWLEMNDLGTGLAPTQKMGSLARLLHVTKAQDLWRRQLSHPPAVSQYALPEAFQETPMAGA